MIGRRVRLSQTAMLPLFAFAANNVAHAQPTATWAGGTGGWHQATRWADGVVPPEGAIVYIDGGNPVTSNVSGSGAVPLGGLYIDSGDVLRLSTIALTGELHVDGALTQSSTVQIRDAVQLSGTGMVNATIVAASDTPPGKPALLTMKNGQLSGTLSLGSSAGGPSFTVEHYGKSGSVSNPLHLNLRRPLRNVGHLIAGINADGLGDIDNRDGILERPANGTFHFALTSILGGTLHSTTPADIGSPYLDVRVEPIRFTGGPLSAGRMAFEDVTLFGAVFDTCIPQIRDGSMEFSGGGTLTFLTGATVSVASGPLINRDCTIRGAGGLATSGSFQTSFENYGSIVPDDELRLPIIKNYGAIHVADGATLLSGVEQRGAFVVEAGGTFRGGILHDAPESTIHGTFDPLMAGMSVHSGTLKIATPTFNPGSIVISGGKLDLSGAPGTISTGGSLRLNPGSVLTVDFGGTNEGVDADQIVVNYPGGVTLDGTIEIVCAPGFIPTPGMIWQVIRGGVGVPWPRPHAIRAVGFPEGLDITYSLGGPSPAVYQLSIHVTRPGDLNCDGVVSVGDIAPFVLRLTDFAAFAAAYPGCVSQGLNADINRDGAVSVGDIAGMVDLLIAN